MAGQFLTVSTFDFLFQCSALALCSVLSGHVSNITSEKRLKKQMKQKMKPDLTKTESVLKTKKYTNRFFVRVLF